MFESPCKTCLVFSICGIVCDKKMYFTAERFSRLVSYRNIKDDSGASDPLIIALMDDLWDENRKIAKRTPTSHLDDLGDFEKQKRKIKKIMSKKTSYHNTKYCHRLMKHYNIERSTYADKV